MNQERVRVILHKDLFTGIYKPFLPSFNNHGFELLFTRIPNISDTFVYMNDDFFLCRCVRFAVSNREFPSLLSVVCPASLSLALPIPFLVFYVPLTCWLDIVLTFALRRETFPWDFINSKGTTCMPSLHVQRQTQGIW